MRQAHMQPQAAQLRQNHKRGDQGAQGVQQRDQQHVPVGMDQHKGQRRGNAPHDHKPQGDGLHFLQAAKQKVEQKQRQEYREKGQKRQQRPLPQNGQRRRQDHQQHQGGPCKPQPGQQHIPQDPFLAGPVLPGLDDAFGGRERKAEVHQQLQIGRDGLDIDNASIAIRGQHTGQVW